jgi:integrase/recombinase XerD
LTVRHGKGEKERSFRIDGPVFQVVKAYIEGTGRSFANSKDLASVLFRSRQGNGGLTTVRAWQIITSYAREAGIAKVTSPHVMRHTFATQCLLQRKAPPVQVLHKVLGHSQLDTTMRYAHIADQARMYSLTGSWLPA